MTTAPLRWGQIVPGGFLAELILIVFVIPVRLAGGSDTALTTVAVAGSYVVRLQCPLSITWHTS